MRSLVFVVACAAMGCGAQAVQQAQSCPAAADRLAPDPAARAAAELEVTELLVAHCERGIHNSVEHTSSDGPLLVVGTAGETMEGNALLEETNASYASRGIEVRYDCSEVQRWVYASATGDVVWAAESIRTNARFPGLEVAFPSARTLVFERTPEGFRLRYYSLAVQLPDENLDEVFGVRHREAQPTADGTAPAR